MFILLKSGAMLNLFWLQDCFQGKHDKNIVIFYTITGTKIIEEYDTADEALQRVTEVHKSMKDAMPKFDVEVVDKLPTENISETTIYLVPSTSDDSDMYKEYIYKNGKWELLGIQKLDLKPIENRLAELEDTVSWHDYE